MLLRPLTLALAASLASLGCLSSSGSNPNDGQTGLDAGVLDSSVPVQTVDGSVLADGAVPGFVTGLGSGQVEHSPSFTLITKTGDLPGGAGLKSSPSFHLISGVGASATK
jgi:hypothetical protein